MDIFPIKFTYGARSPWIYKFAITVVALALNVVTWFVFAATLAAGVKYGLGVR